MFEIRDQGSHPSGDSVGNLAAVVSKSHYPQGGTR